MEFVAIIILMLIYHTIYSSLPNGGKFMEDQLYKLDSLDCFQFFFFAYFGLSNRDSPFIYELLKSEKTWSSRIERKLQHLGLSKI